MKALLLLGAAWLGYEWYVSHGSAAPVAAAPPLGGIQPKPADTTAKPPTVTGSDPAPAGVAPTASATALIKAAILSKAGTGLQNIDTWCWYYANERGVPCPAPDETIPADQRGKMLSFDEFWGWAQARGLSGYGLAGYYRS